VLDKTEIINYEQTYFSGSLEIFWKIFRKYFSGKATSLVQVSIQWSAHNMPVIAMPDRAPPSQVSPDWKIAEGIRGYIEGQERDVKSLFECCLTTCVNTCLLITRFELQV